jgi:nitrite reductase (cytochrome c-552)
VLGKDCGPAAVVDDVILKSITPARRGSNCGVWNLGAARRGSFRAKSAGVAEKDLAPVLELQRKAQWRLDFIAAENSMGFHAPQEAARVLGRPSTTRAGPKVSALKLLK